MATRPFNPNIARFTEIDHNYFHDMASGDGETIVLGGVGVCGDLPGNDEHGGIQFVRQCDGDPEIVSTKEFDQYDPF